MDSIRRESTVAKLLRGIFKGPEADWEFDTDGDPAGWGGFNQWEGPAVDGGVLVGRRDGALGSDPERVVGTYTGTAYQRCGHSGGYGVADADLGPGLYQQA